MQQLQQLWIWLALAIPFALKLGVAVGLLGTALETLGGVLAPLPLKPVAMVGLSLVWLGKKLEAVGADIPKLLEDLKPWLAKLGINVGSTIMLVVPLVLFCSACFGKGPLAPVAGCAPSSSQLLDSVAVILLAGGDYETKLENLALQEGHNVVDCAVDALVKQWTKPTFRTDADHQGAVERGVYHLAQRHAK